jgi:hypothetical protein
LYYPAVDLCPLIGKKCICDVKKYAEKADKNCENISCPVTECVRYGYFDRTENIFKQAFRKNPLM